MMIAGRDWYSELASVRETKAMDPLALQDELERLQELHGEEPDEAPRGRAAAGKPAGKKRTAEDDAIDVEAEDADE